MKPVVLHGPGISESRKKLLELRQKFDPNNVVVFEKGSNSDEILAAIQTVPMFSEERLIIAENPPSDFVFDYSLYPNPYSIILWFDHEIDPKKYSQAEVLFFPEAKEVSVFPFLDKLAEKDKNAYLKLDKLKKAGYDSQYFITMIFYLLRNLVYQPKNMHPFAKQKAIKQSKNFSYDEIISLYKFILETDFKIKKGLMEPDQAEFLLTARFADFS